LTESGVAGKRDDRGGPYSLVNTTTTSGFRFGCALRPSLVAKKTDWRERYRSIVELEKHLHRNSTRIIKFFLHLSKEEQRKRFLVRIDDPDKNWKFSQADLAERKFWDQYMQVYGDCMSAIGTKTAPWHIVPANAKYNARLIISRIVHRRSARSQDELSQNYRARLDELRVIRKQLEK
jgi:hypothetical protein